jgi:hypothetical protein
MVLSAGAPDLSEAEQSRARYAARSDHSHDNRCQEQKRDSAEYDIKPQRYTHWVSPLPVADSAILPKLRRRATTNEPKMNAFHKVA